MHSLLHYPIPNTQSILIITKNKKFHGKVDIILWIESVYGLLLILKINSKNESNLDQNAS